MEYISLGLTIAFAVFLGLGFLLGFKRGLKRTVVRAVWIVAIVILMALISMTITKKLFDIKFNLVLEGQTFATIRDYITHLFQKNLPLEGVDYSSLVNLVITIAGMFINIVIFLIGYWVLKIVTLLFYWITNIFIFAGERRKKRRAKKEKQKYKIKKYRLLGGLTGCVLGLLSFLITMTPVVGYISIAKTVESRTATDSEDGKGLISDVAGDYYSQFMSEYEKSVPIKVMDAVGLDNVLNFVFDTASSTTINDQRVTLSSEAAELSDVYMIAKNMKFPDLNTATQQEVGDFLDTTDKLVDGVFESQIVSASADAIIPFAANYAKQSIDTTEFKPHVMQFYDAFFDQFEGLNAVTTKQEIKGAINVIRVLNKRNLLLPIIQNNTGDIVEFLKLNLTKPAVDEVMESVFSLSTVNNLAPAMVNFLLGEGAEELGYEYNSENQILASTLKSSATSILYSTVDLLQVYDANSPTKVALNKSTVGALGSILDEIKLLVSQENFKSIVNSIEPTLEKTALEAVGDVPQFLKNSISKVIINISEVGGFENSFTSLYDAYEVVKAEFDNAYLEAEDKYDVELMDFEKLGKSLNIFQNNDLIGRQLFLDTMKDAISYYLDEAETSIEGNKPFTFTFDEVVLNNIEMLKGTGIDWSVELPVYKQTAGYVANLLQDTDNIIDRLKSDADPTIEGIGYELEHNLKTSALFTGADRLLVADLLVLADCKINTSSDQKLNDNLSTLLLDAKENVLNEPVVNWETEFKHIKKIIKIEFEDTSDESILKISNTLDSIVFDTVDEGEVILEGSVIFKQDMINNFIVDYMDTIFEEVEETDSFYSTLQQIKMSFETETITSYANEFDALLKLKSINEITSEDGFDFKTGGVSIGIKIDEALAVGVVEEGVDPKVVVDKALINNFIQNQMDSYLTDYSSDLSKEITTIKNGFNDNVQLYEVEFTAITNLMNVVDTATAAGFDFNDKTSASSLGADIDTTLDVVTVEGVDYNSTIITRDLINGYIKRVINDKVNLGSDSEFAEVLTTITGTKNADDTYQEGRIDTFRSTYEREFGYLAQLVTVSNNFTDITIDTINTPNATTHSTVAEEFDGSATILDPLRNSYLVGDSLLRVIDNVLEKFTNDADNADYSAILAEVNTNYASVKAQVTWISNASGTKTYTQVINALVEIEDALNGNLTQDINDINQVSSIADSYDTALATLQNNILMSVNGTNELAQFAMTKVLNKMNEQASTFTSAIDYAENYIDYLKYTKTTNQPYINTTTVNVYRTATSWSTTVPASGTYTTVQINKPFEKVGDLIDNALGV